MCKYFLLNTLHAYIYGSHSVKFAFIERDNIFLSVSSTYVSFYLSPPPKLFPKLFFPKTCFAFPIFIRGEACF